MRFRVDGPSIPDSLLEKCDAGRVVFFCGAGISCYPKNSALRLPNFRELTNRIIRHFRPSPNSDIMKAMKLLDESETANSTSLDEIFYLIQKTFCKEEVNQKISEILSKNSTLERPTRHKHIAQISSDQEGIPQIVTTNFDVFFEKAIPESNKIRVNVPPFLPDLSQHSPVSGITYLHGRTSEKTNHIAIDEKHLNKFVLSSADLGRAYLSEGWAANFVRYIFSNYTVVLIGYRAEDPPIHYLLMGMNDNVNFDQSNLYAFDRSVEDQEEVRAKWHAKGVTPILYSSHDILWESIAEWADKFAFPNKWKSRVAQNISTDPRLLESYERGQIAYLMRTVDGTRKLRDSSFRAHPGWINVFDSKIRLEEEHKTISLQDKKMVSQLIYGLDDEEYLKTNRNFNDEFSITDLVTDSNHATCGKVHHENREKERNLIYWIASNLDNPLIALWALKQSYLSKNLITSLKWKLGKASYLNSKPRLLWKLIIDVHDRNVDSVSSDAWRYFLASVNDDGWVESTLREFSKLTSPLLVCKSRDGALDTLVNASSWNDIDIGDILEVKVEFPEIDLRNLNIPDHALSRLIIILQNNLLHASFMISEADTLTATKTRTPACFQNREIYKDIGGKDYTVQILRFLDFLERLLEIDPKFVKSLVNSWPFGDSYFFMKLKLVMLNNKSIYRSREMTDYIINLSRDEFWCENCESDLMFSIAENGKAFNMNDRKNIADKILQSPIDLTNVSSAFERRNAMFRSVERGRMLIENDFKFSQKFIQEIERYSQILYGSKSRSVRRYLPEQDTGIMRKPDGGDYEFLDASGEIRSIRSESFLKIYEEMRDIQFSDFVRQKPEQILSALLEEGNLKNYPIVYWKNFIRELTRDTDLYPPIDFAERLVSFPDHIIGKLGLEVSSYLLASYEGIFSVNNEAAWRVIDRCIYVWVRGYFLPGRRPDDFEFVFSNDFDGYGRRSRGNHLKLADIDSSSHPIGIITKLLLDKCRHSEDIEIPSDIKLRINRLLEKSNRNRQHCIATLTTAITYLYQLDEGWVRFNLIPIFDFSQRDSAFAWRGFLNNAIGDNNLILEMSSLIINLFPWANRNSWEKEYKNRCVRLILDVVIFLSEKHKLKYRKQVRECFRYMGDDARDCAILHLASIGMADERKWTEIIAPFIDKTWPKDLIVRTEQSTLCWMYLLQNSGIFFSKLYSVINKFLTPIWDGYIELEPFITEDNGQASLAVRFPYEVLGLVDSVVPYVVDQEVKLLDITLEEIRKSEESISSDPRYIRLLKII